MMNKLSKKDMKKIMGGNVQLRGCYVYCCGNPECMWYGNSLSVSPIDSCEGVTNASGACLGGSVYACKCYGGPYVAD